MANLVPELLCSSALSSFGSFGHSRLVAICAEPGLGSRAVISDLLSGAAAAGARIFRHDLGALDIDSAVSVIRRVAHSAMKASDSVVVGLDDLPAPDECSAPRLARALRRLWESGASVAFSLPPEASQILELLPECQTVRSQDLLVRSVALARPDDSLYELRRLTLGIHDLVSSLADISEDDLRSDAVPQAYRDRLSALVTTSLRRSLSDEEIRLRLCLFLLGEGTIDDLRCALDFVSEEILECIRVFVPYFQLEGPHWRFRTLPTCSPAALSRSLHGLAPTCSLFPDVASSCVRVLLERGSFERAAQLLELPVEDAAFAHALRFGAHLIDAGGVNVVSTALGMVEGAPRRGTLCHALSLAVSAVIGEELVDFGACGRPLEVRAGERRDALMLIDARRALQAKPALVAFVDDAWSGLGRSLLVHREACDLLREGAAGAAMRLLVANPCCGPVRTMSDALLLVDYEIARLLLCDDGGNDGDRVAQALRMLESSSFRGMEGYACCLEAVRAMLSPSARAPNLDALAARSERAGDVLPQVAALVAGCIVDLRGSSCARANVRALLATAIARRAGLVHLSRVASLLGDISRFLLGDVSRREAPGAARDELGAIRLLAHEAMSAEHGPAAVEDELGGRVPRDCLWLVRVLSEGFGAFSQLFRRTLPLSWRPALEAVSGPRGEERLAGAGMPPVAAATGLRDAPPLVRAEAPVKVSLLGGFSLFVRDVRIVDEKIDHRNAKSMLTYLLLRHGHSARRSQISGQIWPESDYVLGANRVYQATSVLRAAVAEIDPSLDPFVLGRSTRSISIDPSVVACDVDELRHFAREVIDGEDDATVVRVARQVEQLYVGDLYSPAADCTGFVAKCREELRSLYVDAMVAGSDAAMRLGRARTAARLAGNALEADGLREDAAIALVSSLMADGRELEAGRQYRRYARRLSQATGKSPSWRLRQVARDEPTGEEGEASA